MSNLETVTRELRAKLRTRPGTVATQPPRFVDPPRWRPPPSTTTFPRQQADKPQHNHHVISILHVDTHRLQQRLSRINTPKSYPSSNTLCPITLTRGARVGLIGGGERPTGRAHRGQAETPRGQPYGRPLGASHQHSARSPKWLLRRFTPTRPLWPTSPFLVCLYCRKPTLPKRQHNLRIP